MNHTIITDFLEWKYQLQKNCTWEEYDFYFEIQNILPYITGYMISVDSVVCGEKLLATPHKFDTYTALSEYVTEFTVTSNYLHCVLKHKVDNSCCLWWAVI